MRYRDFLKAVLQNRIHEQAQLPSGFHLVGHVALLQLDRQLFHHARLVGEATLQYDNRIRSVAVKVGPTTGVTRRPAYALVAGDPETTTTHVENGVKFRLDPLRLTFSGGNRGERIRIPSLVQPDEVVVDMFACVGQFALHIAKRSKASRVIAIEINPEAYGFLLESVELNRIGNRVQTLLGDCREVNPTHVADRVIMGYLHETVLYLPYALQTLCARGGIIHMHIALPRKEVGRTMDLVRTNCDKVGFAVRTQVRRVRSYAPGIEHYVFNIQVEPDK